MSAPDSSDPSEGEVFVFNGLMGSSGAYLAQPMSAEAVVERVLGVPRDAELDAVLDDRDRRRREQRYVLMEGYDHDDLAQAGWGLVTAPDTPPAWLEALEPLLALRRAQAGERFRQLAYAPGESRGAFLARHGAGPGPVNPDKVPYYLMLLGGPEALPYAFQWQLDVTHAVGRLDLDDPQALASYAATVVASEAGELGVSRRLALWAPENPDDRSTALSQAYLARPLIDAFGARPEADWTLTPRLADGASRSALEALLGGEDPHGIVFSASHGMGFERGDPRQLAQTGALVAQDWPGPSEWGLQAVPEDMYLAADHVASGARVAGSLVFNYACFGAGSPLRDSFAERRGRETAQIAERPFVSALTRRLLGHPSGGALACIGQADRAWGCSFVWREAGSQTEVFESVLRRLMRGERVGYAMEFFDQRYAAIATELNALLADLELGRRLDRRELAAMWTAMGDARSYVVNGDPAVRLRVGDDTRSQREPPRTAPAVETPAPLVSSAHERLRQATEALLSAAETLDEARVERLSAAVDGLRRLVEP